MRRNVIRIGLIVPLVLILAMLGPGPAFATPLRTAGASAFGLSSSGLLTIAPTPTISVGFPPGSNQQALLTLPLGDLVFSGTAEVRAQTSLDSTITPLLPADRIVRAGGGPLPAGYNARGHAILENASLLGPNILPVLTAGVLQLRGVSSEALVSCVNGQPVFATGHRIVGIGVAGTDLTVPVDNLVNQVVDVSNSLLSAIVEIRRNVVTQTPNGISVNALEIRVLGTTLVVTVAHSEVTGATCEPVDVPECRDGIDNDGDGRIDFPNDPDCTSPDDDSEAGLARTGGFGPGYGMAILAGGGLLMLAAYRLRRWKLSAD